MSSVNNKYPRQFFEKFWYIPSDALIRSFEYNIWKNIPFLYPNLNIGCGDGRYDELIFPKRVFSYGLDISKKDVEIARKSKLYKNVLVANANKMPFKNCYFSQIISNSTMEHIKDDLNVIKEVSRVLKKGGSFCFTTTTDLLKIKLLKEFGNEKFEYFNKRMNHYHYRSISEWRHILNDNGLTIKKHIVYMNPKSLQIWIKLLNLFTFKINKRELWSYLRDSKYSKYFPNKMFSNIELLMCRIYLNDTSSKIGAWQYIQTQKVV